MLDWLIPFVKRYLFLVCVVAGLTLVFIDVFAFAPATPSPWKQLFHVLGTTILAGGVFASLVKSYQFMGVFREDISLAVTKPELYLSDKHIVSVWKNLAKCIYKNKFPELNEEIISSIADKYLPVNHNHYKKDHTTNIKITNPGIDDFIDIEETNTLTLVPSDAVKEVFFRFTSRIPLAGATDDQTFYRINKLDVSDDKGISHNIEPEFKQETLDDALRTQWSITLPKNNHYKISYTISKRMSLRTNPSYGFKTTHLISKLSVSVAYPETWLEVDFFEMGTVHGFVGASSAKGLLTKQCDGIIFPSQGFRLIYRRIGS